MTAPLSSPDAKALALSRFADPGPDHINCAQAVLAFALAVKGLDADLITVARYFGGGVAGMGEVCGAVSGATLALGVRDQFSPSGTDGHDRKVDSPAATRAALQEIMRAFTTEFGSLRCRELTGYDLSTAEGHDAFVKSGANERCPLMVGWMCDRLAPLLAP